MNIAKIDPNFQIKTTVTEPDVVWMDGRKAPFRLYGIADRTHVQGDYRRMPEAVAETVSPGVAGLNTHTAGIRLRFATNSPYIALTVEWQGIRKMEHMPLSGSSGFDLFRVKNGIQSFQQAFMPQYGMETGFAGIYYAREEGVTDYVLNFPLYNDVDKVYIGVKEGSVIEAGSEEYSNEKPVIFYGSSITQGGCASRPGNCYQNILSRELNMDYINLGFSGNAKGEPAIAEFIAKQDMAIFVSDYDHNAPTIDHLKNTHFALYETVRKAHPDIPYIMITRPDWHEDWDNNGRIAVVADSFRRAYDLGDRHVYFINGSNFYGGFDADTYGVDGCHPTDLGFYFMAQTMMPLFKRLLY